jgi:hypothetical protein
MKHKHAELIKAWADGAEIERFLENYGIWISTDNKIIRWEEDYKYRIKSEPKPDVVLYSIVHNITNDRAFVSNAYAIYEREMCDCNLKLTFDGETGKIKSAEVI